MRNNYQYHAASEDNTSEASDIDDGLSASIPSYRSGHSESMRSDAADGRTLTRTDTALEEEDAKQLLARSLHNNARTLGLEKTSVHGAAVLIPQLARSTDGNAGFVMLSVKSYLLLLLSFALQGILLTQVGREQNVMDLFSDQMWLCDFGAPLNTCPEDPSCEGPGGTPMDPRRAYTFQIWHTRKFIQKSLKVLFPEKEADIESKVDVGEYGAESRLVRLVACFVFMMELYREIINLWQMFELHLRIPNEAECWFSLDGSTHKHSATGLEHVKIEIAGMPIPWKAINGLLIILPKLLLWKLTAEVGVTFLMETADISSMIVNALALAFVMNLDELAFENFSDNSTKSYLHKCCDYEIQSKSAHRSTCVNFDILYIWTILPVDLIVTTFIWAFFVGQYYYQHCDYAGWFYSKEVYYPRSVDYTIFNAVFPAWFPLSYSNKSFWSMLPLRDTAS